MANPAYPDALPWFGKDVSFDPQDPRVRTSMDMGPAKMHRRFTAKTVKLAATLWMDGAQLEQFLYFFETTLRDGSEKFDAVYPFDDSTREFQFVSMPKWQLARGGSVPERLYPVQVEVEVLP